MKLYFIRFMFMVNIMHIHKNKWFESTFKVDWGTYFNKITCSFILNFGITLL